MKSRKPTFTRPLAADLAPDDGLDPRFDHAGARRPGKRKTLQLCREAERTLSAVLGGECDDDVLQELTVLSVVPAPNAGRLLVTLTLPPSASVTADQALEHVLRASGRLRGELASAVRRRKVAELAFRVVSVGHAP
jgi:hypothetical protein